MDTPRPLRREYTSIRRAPAPIVAALAVDDTLFIIVTSITSPEVVEYPA